MSADHPEFEVVVDRLHRQYMAALEDLYKKHADDYYLGEAAEWFAPRPPIHKLQAIKFVDSKL